MYVLQYTSLTRGADVPLPDQCFEYAAFADQRAALT